MNGSSKKILKKMMKIKRRIRMLVRMRIKRRIRNQTKAISYTQNKYRKSPRDDNVKQTKRNESKDSPKNKSKSRKRITPANSKPMINNSNGLNWIFSDDFEYELDMAPAELTSKPKFSLFSSYRQKKNSGSRVNHSLTWTRVKHSLIWKKPPTKRTKAGQELVSGPKAKKPRLNLFAPKKYKMKT